MDTNLWEDHLKDFLVETAEMYYTFLSSKQPKYAAITKLDGIYGVFQEVRMLCYLVHWLIFITIGMVFYGKHNWNTQGKKLLQ